MTLIVLDVDGDGAPVSGKCPCGCGMTVTWPATEPAPVVRGVRNDLKRVVPGLSAVVVCPAYRDPSCPTAPVSEIDDRRPWCAEPHLGRLHSMIVHLNDGCQWTREEVADWLETLDLDLSFQEAVEPEPEPEPCPWSGASVPMLSDSQKEAMAESLKGIWEPFTSATMRAYSRKFQHQPAFKQEALPSRPGSQNYLKLKEKDRERSRRHAR